MMSLHFIVYLNVVFLRPRVHPPPRSARAYRARVPSNVIFTNIGFQNIFQAFWVGVRDSGGSVECGHGVHGCANFVS